MKKILIVEDNKAMRHIIRKLLSAIDKYRIDEAKNGFEAEEKLNRFIYDLIILDIKMPGKDGYELCFQIRNSIMKTQCKIIAVSGLPGDIEAPFINALGADYFFEKPFDPEKFKNKVQELLSSTHPQQS